MPRSTRKADPARSLADILDLDIPTPKRGRRLYIDLVAPRVEPGAPAGAPVCLWVPEASIDLPAEKPGSPWALIDGSVASLEKANKGRAGMARTAAHIVDAASDEEAKAIVFLALLRNLEHRRKDLSEAARSLMGPLLENCAAGSALELWASRSAYLLPGEPEGWATAETGAMRDITAQWLCEDLGAFRPARVQPRSAKRASRPTLGSFNLAVDGFDDGGRFAPVRSRWQSLTKEELQKLVWEKSVSEISREFNVARPVIDRACKRRGIVKPPSWFGKARAHGHDVNARLIAEGYDPIR